MENNDSKSRCWCNECDMDKLMTYFILYSEAGILDDMVVLFNNLTWGLVYSDKDVIERSRLLKKIMCGFSAKEKAIAEVIMASARKNAADSGLDPSEVCCKCCGKTRHESRCNCNHKMGC